MNLTQIYNLGKSFAAKATAITVIFFGVLAMSVGTAQAQAFSEDFAVVPVPGWTVQNNSVPTGSTTWFQGNSTVFPSQAGAPTAYIGCNFNSVTGANTISNWFISPNRTFSNGDQIKFWTRTVTNQQFPDRLQVRLSTNGTSTNVGTGAVAVGDFTNLLLDINPMYDLGVYPSVWTEFTITLSGLAGPTSGRIAFRYFVEMGGPAGDNSDFIGIDTFSYTPGMVAMPGDAPVDFDGDGKTDWVVTRNTGGGAAGQLTWFWNINGAATPTAASAWGLNTDVLTPADFDGDQKDDIAIWRPGAATVAAFYILNSATMTARVEPFGQTGDNPTVVNNYGGTAADDLAVWRESNGTWYYRTVANGPVTFVPWGASGDFVAPGDYDGDGTADFGVQRGVAGAGQFWIRLSTGVVQPVTTFGFSTDFVITADFDGDSKTDIAVYRSGTWYWRPSSGGADQQTTFGIAGDVAAPGDYNGDGRADLAVFRNGVFYVYSPTGGTTTFFTLGAAGDQVPAQYNVH